MSDQEDRVVDDTADYAADQTAGDAADQIEEHAEDYGDEPAGVFAPIKLVQASDLHLESPLRGLPEAPEHLRELLRDAPYHAAEQVFDTALAEEADALLLAGDVIDVDLAGPRGVVFLLEQFKRLEARGIAVFWAGGVADPPDRWPPGTPLPENVHYFPIGRVEQHELVRDGKMIARVQGTSCRDGEPVDARGFHADVHGNYTIGIAYGTSDAPGKEGDRVNYMALGGRHRRATVDVTPGIAHYAGTPQGRTSEELGPAGCTVITVDDRGKTKTRFVSTDVVRWAEETVEFTAGTTVDQLRKRMQERLDKLRQKTRDVDQLVAWNLQGAGPLLVQLTPGGLLDKLLIDLQKHDGRQQPACWSYAVRCGTVFEPPAEWLDQETILGDLLRQLGVFTRNDAFVLDLKDMLPKRLPDPSLESIATITPAEKEELFDRAEKLGISLLTDSV